MAKKKKDHGNLSKAKVQNLVAKHSRNMAGAGAHVDKKGEKAPRVRQKRQWKKDAGMMESIIDSAREADPFQDAIHEIEKDFDINLSEGTCGSENEEEFDAKGLSDDQMHQLTDYIHDNLLGGKPITDFRELENAAQMALDDVPGFETGDNDRERDNVVGRIVSIYNQKYGKERM